MSDPDDALKAALLADLDAFIKVEHRQPGDLDIDEFARHHGMGPTWAKHTLRALVAQGVLTEHSVVSEQGRRALVFRPVKKAA